MDEPRPGDMVIAEETSAQKKHGFPLYQKGELLEFEGRVPMDDPGRPRALVWSRRRGRSLEVWLKNFRLYRRKGA